VRYVIKNIIQGRHTIKELGIIFAVERAEANIKLVKTIPHGKIRGLKNSGLAGGNVAAQFGVSRTTVGKIWRGERWKHMVSAT